MSEQPANGAQPRPRARFAGFRRPPAASKTVKIVVGPEPRVSLLPAEVVASRRGRRLRGRMLAVGLVVALLMGATHFAAAGRAAQAQRELADAQALTSELLTRQGQFADLRRVTGAIEDAEAARDFGASTEIDWPGWLRDLQVALPQSVTIETVTIDAASPLVAYTQSALPLQPARVATVTLSLTSPTIPQVSELLTAVQTLSGYADGKPGLVSRAGTGSYQVELTLHIDATAYVNGVAAELGG